MSSSPPWTPPPQTRSVWAHWAPKGVWDHLGKRSISLISARPTGPQTEGQTAALGGARRDGTTDGMGRRSCEDARAGRGEAEKGELAWAPRGGLEGSTGLRLWWARLGGCGAALPLGPETTALHPLGPRSLQLPPGRAGGPQLHVWASAHPSTPTHTCISVPTVHITPTCAHAAPET